MMALAVTDLPDPDSPMTHRIWPRFRSKEMFSTAWVRSMPAGKFTVRSRTESATSWGATGWMLATIAITSLPTERVHLGADPIIAL